MMTPGKSARYSAIYLKPEVDDPLATAVVVQEKFSLAAFLVAGFWLLYHRLWLPFMAYLVVMVAIGLAQQPFGLEEWQIGIFQLVLNLWVALEAPYLRVGALEARGYQLYDYVLAADESQAMQRFLDMEFSEMVSVNPRVSKSGNT